jgi:hypothetical protein
MLLLDRFSGEWLVFIHSIRPVQLSRPYPQMYDVRYRWSFAVREVHGTHFGHGPLLTEGGHCKEARWHLEAVGFRNEDEGQVQMGCELPLDSCSTYKVPDGTMVKGHGKV